MLSRKLLRSAVVAAVAIVPMLLGAEVASASVKVGVLTCHVAPGVGLIIGSRKALSCSFSPTGGTSEYYSGRITRLGIDIGITGKGVIVWGVFAAHGGYARHALAGHYGGASAEASLDRRAWRQRARRRLAQIVCAPAVQHQGAGRSQHRGRHNRNDADGTK